MRICFSRENWQRRTEGDLLCIPYLGKVSYEAEIEGRSSLLRMLAERSRAQTVISGCTTDAQGIVRRSAAVADRGKLIGITDVTHSIDDDGDVGAENALYRTKAGRIGVLVGVDLFFPEMACRLVECGAETLVVLAERSRREALLLVRAYSVCYGIPVIYSARDYSLIAVRGECVGASPVFPFAWEIERDREFHVVRTRRSGYFSDERRRPDDPKR
ncbi:MAG: hypothetical protein ACI4U2_02535 [Christensenellaceae bacterium]